MFCPNCGSKNSTEQKFCRSCGLNLEDTAQSLLEQIPSAESANLLKRERRLEKFGTFAWSGFQIILLAGICAIIYAIITNMILTGKNVWIGILLTAFVIFAALALIYVSLNEDLKERKLKSAPGLRNDLRDERDTAKLLEETSFEPISSVTENTTDLLHAEPKTRKLE